MKKILLMLVATALLIQTSYARTIEVDVHGMTCAFCVDSLERKFSKMESVSKVEVSLKLKKVRLETDEDLPKVDVIKQAILDAGFTPVKVTVVTSEKSNDADKKSDDADNKQSDNENEKR